MKTQIKSNVGRKPLDIRFPIRKKGVTVEQVVNFQKMEVSPLTVRNRLRGFVEAKAARVEHLPVTDGPAHPKYRYVLDYKKVERLALAA